MTTALVINPAVATDQTMITGWCPIACPIASSKGPTVMESGSFGEYVTLVRKQHDYSINELAAHLGVAPSTISRLEDGSRPLPRPDLVLDLIKNLNLDAVTAVGLLEPYRRLTQACLPGLASYLRIKYRMKRKDITELTRHARQLGYDPK